MSLPTLPSPPPPPPPPLVQVKSDHYFPADLLCLASTNGDGVCYIEVRGGRGRGGEGPSLRAQVGGGGVAGARRQRGADQRGSVPGWQVVQAMHSRLSKK